VLLSVLIVAFVAAYVLRGWRRGLVVEVVELVGLVAAILAAYLLWPVIRALADGWMVAVGGFAVFAVVFGAALACASWAGRHTSSLPTFGVAVDGLGGTLFAATWSLLLATAMLVLAVTAPGARARLAEPVCGSGVAPALISDANPLHPGGERLAVLGRPVLLWLNQQFADGLALSHSESICDDLPRTDEPGRAPDPTHFTFPESTDDEISVDEDAEEEVLRLLNAARAEAGLDPVERRDDVREVARAHSHDMYVRGYFAHETPECREEGRDAEGCTDPFDRMQAAGITYNVAGENLALAPSPQQAHDGLMRSPGHRANILNPDFTHVGIGVYRGPYGLMVTQKFTG
jgi:uncharacterized protein YkwD